MIKGMLGVSRQDGYFWLAKQLSKIKSKKGNQDSLTTLEEMSEKECPVKPGQVLRNVDGT
jgi:hypothetical protein